MIRILTPLALTFLASSCLAQGLPMHFDMTPEASLVTPDPAPEAVSPQSAPVVRAPELVRYLLPEGDTRFSGETDRRNYQIYLTAAQASAKATINLGYINALVVAPEASRLRVQINGSTVLLNEVASAAGTARLTADVPAEILKAGFNTVTITADLRHRTDCSIGSTYELWTDLSAADTYLAFTGSRVGQLTRLDDLAAAGWNLSGQSVLRIATPGSSPTENGLLVAALVQQIALAMRVTNVQVEFAEHLNETQEPGVLNILLAPASELPELAGPLAQEARTSTVAAFAPNAGNVLVLSGPSWSDLSRTVEDIAAIVNQYGQSAGTLPPRADRALPVPVFTGAGSMSFERLGFQGLSFNGRRYHNSFSFALPSDFYADQYGQAHVTLNAAYSGEVKAGSQFEIYVNGEIASVTPLLRTDDAFRDLPIKIPMSEFRPGVNEVEIVGELRTEADDICAPGTVTVGTDQRLLISGDSTFTMPDFGRISQVPNLAAFANTGFPYTGADQTNLVIGNSEQSLPAALTMLARMAGHTNSIVSVASISLASPSPAQDAIFVGAYGQLPPDSIRRIGVLQPYATDDNSLDADSNNLDTILQRWRSVGMSGDSSIVNRIQNWVADLLDLGPNSLGVLPPEDLPYAPRLSDRALLLQRLQPEGGLWTMLTVPTTQGLDAGVKTITAGSTWPTMSGWVSVLPQDGSAPTVIRPNRVTFYESGPWTLANLRSVIANWLSSHVLAYGIGLCIILAALTLATTRVLRVTGRDA
ncbi:cellulose biosynthesis cyclic di-GMP-binding regulatory protein BcsB [Devosia sp. Naph2]|uniref:cellulose biosynthesis cyclic di-GMP-binding regulatory protein BcsB n=1 Tax=Devosia polycyclovorans TaxID=3345148 RepID=UPI0035CF7F8C